MAEISIAGGGTGSTGALAADTHFHIKDGSVELSSDAGATYVEYASGSNVIFASGLTVHFRNIRPVSATIAAMFI